MNDTPSNPSAKEAGKHVLPSGALVSDSVHHKKWRRVLLFFRPALYLAVVALFAYAVWDAAQPVAQVRAVAAVSWSDCTQPEQGRVISLPKDLRGTIVGADQPVEIRSTVDGTVAALMVKEGDAVKKGQLLIRLDDTAWQNALACCEIAPWVDSRRSGESNGDNEAAAPTAGAFPEASSSGITKLLRSVIAQGNIVSPVNGVVGQVRIAPGHNVQASAVSGMLDNPPLVVVYPADHLAVETTVTPKEAGRIGMGSIVQVIVESVPGVTLDGVVVSMCGSLDQSGGHCKLRVSLAHAPDSLQPGMEARIIFRETEAERERRASVLIPKDALIDEEGEKAVFWVIGADNLLQKREALRRPVWDEAERLAVLGGVRPGEPVVIQPDASLREGQRVTTE